MPGDKLKRVKSVKKWLDKAENSYLNNKDISGELNLMMAQAEMQRLKETHPHEKAKRWGIRLSAMAAAAVLFISVFRLCQACEPGTENHPLCGWKINGYTNKKITIRFI